MARNMSFFLTTAQIRDRSKRVTRRLGWKSLRVGDLLNACVKCQGLGKGGKIERLAHLRVTGVRREPLDRMSRHAHYGADEARMEGFPNRTGREFVAMFCEHMKCLPHTEVTVIEFEYVDE